MKPLIDGHSRNWLFALLAVVWLGWVVPWKDLPENYRRHTAAMEKLRITPQAALAEAASIEAKAKADPNYDGTKYHQHALRLRELMGRVHETDKPRDLWGVSETSFKLRQTQERLITHAKACVMAHLDPKYFKAPFEQYHRNEMVNKSFRDGMPATPGLIDKINWSLVGAWWLFAFLIGLPLALCGCLVKVAACTSSLKEAWAVTYYGAKDILVSTFLWGIGGVGWYDPERSWAAQVHEASRYVDPNTQWSRYRAVDEVKLELIDRVTPNFEHVNPFVALQAVWRALMANPMARKPWKKAFWRAVYLTVLGGVHLFLGQSVAYAADAKTNDSPITGVMWVHSLELRPGSQGSNNLFLFLKKGFEVDVYGLDGPTPLIEVSKVWPGKIGKNITYYGGVALDYNVAGERVAAGGLLAGFTAKAKRLGLYSGPLLLMRTTAEEDTRLVLAPNMRLLYALSKQWAIGGGAAVIDAENQPVNALVGLVAQYSGKGYTLRVRLGRWISGPSKDGLQLRFDAAF